MIDTDDISTVISGGASGVDKMAERWADEMGYKKEIHPAEWKKYGRRAGPMRNIKIIESCTRVVAFPSKKGRGTQDSIKKAAGLQLDVIWV